MNCKDKSDESFCDGKHRINLAYKAYFFRIFLKFFFKFTEWRSFNKSLVDNPNNGALCLGGGGKFYGHPNFALAILAPILLSTIFMIPQWLRQEKSKKRILKTLPLLLFQVYPQFKMLEILYLGLWKKDSKWRLKKEEHQKSVAYIGKSKDNTAI